MECGHWKSLPGRSAASALEPCDFRFNAEGDPIGLEELLVRHALDLPGWNSPREGIASGVMMLPVPKSGILEGVSGEDAARSIPGINRIVDHRPVARCHRCLGRMARATWDFFLRGEHAGESRARAARGP